MSVTRTNEVRMLDDIGKAGFTFDSVADMKASTQLGVGQKVRTLGYYTPGDGGGNDYEIVAAATSVDDGGSFIDLAGSGTQAKGLFPDRKAHTKQFGAKGDLSQTETVFLQKWADYFPSLGYGFIDEGIYNIDGELVVTGSEYKLEGTSRMGSVIRTTNNTNVFVFKNSGKSITSITIKDFTVRHIGENDKSGGAFFDFFDRAIEPVVENIDIRGAFIGFILRGTARGFFKNIACNQSGRKTTAGRAFFDIRPTSDGMVCTGNHFTDIEMLTVTTLDSPTDFGFLVRNSDGIYITNSHFQGCSTLMAFYPDDAPGNTTLASVLVSNTYFDSCGLSHLDLGGVASTAYRHFKFSNCQFRASGGGFASIKVDLDGGAGLEGLSFVGCVIRDNVGSGIKASNSTNTIKDLILSGCDFSNNNTGNSSANGDLITRSKFNTITGNRFSGGGASGYAIRFLAGADRSVIQANNFWAHAGATIIADGGLGNQIRDNKGFVTESDGQASISDNATSVTVNHNLDLTPSQANISVTPTSPAAASSSFWVSNVTANTFDILLTASPGDGNTSVFAWKAVIE